MNDGVGAGVGVLKSVFQHLEKQGKKLIDRDSDDLFELVKQYGEAFATYLGSLSDDEKRNFAIFVARKASALVCGMVKKLSEKNFQILIQMAYSN